MIALRGANVTGTEIDPSVGCNRDDSQDQDDDGNQTCRTHPASSPAGKEPSDSL